MFLRLLELDNSFHALCFRLSSGALQEVIAQIQPYDSPTAGHFLCQPQGYLARSAAEDENVLPPQWAEFFLYPLQNGI
jgi:hypothetical protein